MILRLTIHVIGLWTANKLRWCRLAYRYYWLTVLRMDLNCLLVNLLIMINMEISIMNLLTVSMAFIHCYYWLLGLLYLWAWLRIYTQLWSVIIVWYLMKSHVGCWCCFHVLIQLSTQILYLWWCWVYSIWCGFYSICLYFNFSVLLFALVENWTLHKILYIIVRTASFLEENLILIIINLWICGGGYIKISCISQWVVNCTRYLLMLLNGHI